jgi:hypothetical protein
MKKQLFASMLLLFVIGANAQTAKHQIGFTGGFGFQQYNGDLGNDFYRFHWTKYGVASANVGYYLDKTFDVSMQFTIGDLGFCQTEAVADKAIPLKDRCPGCVGRKGYGNLNSRMAFGGIALKYKLANGDIFKEDAKIAPYFYVGIGMNRITDRMKMRCINPGDYFSINTGVGFKYNITEQFNIGYNIALGCFQSDKVDFMVHSHNNDKYLQNTFFVGMNL